MPKGSGLGRNSSGGVGRSASSRQIATAGTRRFGINDVAPQPLFAPDALRRGFVVYRLTPFEVRL